MNSTNLDFTKGLPVVSNARKLAFKVPESDTTASFPDGVTKDDISDYGQNNKTPVIVVCNATDNDGKGTWQGADSSTGVVLVNNVPGDVAEEALNMFQAGGGTIQQLWRTLAWLASIGYDDQYTTDELIFYKDNLSPAGRMLDDNVTGIVKRDSSDVVMAVCDFNGTIRQNLSDGVRNIEPDILLRDYRNADGSPIDIGAIPVV